MYTCNGKTEVVSFVVKSGRKLTIGVKFEVNDNRNKNIHVPTSLYFTATLEHAVCIENCYVTVF
jgi:hypothetical protein